jgi:tRNA (guanine-N7-)-methyltransferase
MRGGSKISPAAEHVQLVPENYFAPLDVPQIFGRSAPLHVDLGCGDGAYLAALAAENPTHNFLGFERLPGRIRSACNRIARLQLTNARVLLIEISYAVAYLLPAGSVSIFHLLFPDPWPKRRHHSRRSADAAFFESLARALADGGAIRIVTDDADYFAQINATAETVSALKPAAEDDRPFPTSTFEQRFRAAGSPIYRLVLRKTSGVR